MSFVALAAGGGERGRKERGSETKTKTKTGNRHATLALVGGRKWSGNRRLSAQEIGKSISQKEGKWLTSFT